MSKRRMVEIDADGAPQPELARYREAIPVDEDRENRELTGADQGPARVTRGEKKRRAEQLERLGESLVKLPPGKLVRVPMPDDLRAAVVEAQRIKAHGGYRRQIQFIGKIMRTVDARPIAAALESQKGEDAPSALQFVQAERWRDRLIAEGDAALFELVQTHPHADRTLLRQLARRAREEQDARAHGKDIPRHASRGLFRNLRALFGGTGDTEPTDDVQPVDGASEAAHAADTAPQRTPAPQAAPTRTAAAAAPAEAMNPPVLSMKTPNRNTTSTTNKKTSSTKTAKTKAAPTRKKTTSTKKAKKKTSTTKTKTKKNVPTKKPASSNKKTSTKTAAKKTAAKKTAAKKTAAKKTAAKKTAAKKTARRR